MKNQTFAAHRHLPTDKIRILDLALFGKQRMPDSATSLACEYINEDGEKVFAVIASGEQDEPGVTYIALSEKENAEIMEAWFECGGGEFPALSGEYQFESDDDLPEHVVATVEIIDIDQLVSDHVAQLERESDQSIENYFIQIDNQ